ncbi:tyrosine-type recombinase/integrase [Flagellimonas halotolerans]|uniref:Tyrosine-type recombinase/integrase n=1 Tax=Flagellimonas halotolerans TaxID=3112164 RepID=A0ABU6IN71_9FLAO|nr:MULTISPECIES: tyrosine-type recombinase/integrase [unclassified Allomuricauda]MEC3964701.1 tyrosine-type recombinase/integrase [Muricauda sp. SYSU M86414]MEC4264570.1 tyrosine-type recombinase/integrase [Muricauda sp. SYSU M84420]
MFAQILFVRGAKRRKIYLVQFQQIVEIGGKRAKIHMHITAHTLRHSYATHLLEKGIEIRVIQKLLGYNSIKTTMIYTQVSEPTMLHVSSPFDDDNGDHL